MRRTIGQFRRATGGVATIEFALIAIPFFLLLYGILEYGLILFTQVAIESATMQVAREASIGTGTNTPAGVCSREEYVRQLIETKTHGLINGDKVIVTAAPVANGGTPSAAGPDICMSDPPTLGGPCPSGIYEDVNHNGVYDATVPGVALGNPGDLVEIRVSYPWKVLMPGFSKFFGKNGVLLITSSTVLRNEPFAGPGC